MTPKQKATHASLIRQVHTSTRYQAYYSDHREEYEELLQEHFGVTSSKALDIGQLIELVNFLNMRSASLPVMHRRSQATPQQLWKIEQLWHEKARDKETAAQLSFVKRITGRRLKVLGEIDGDEATKVIVAMEAMK